MIRRILAFLCGLAPAVLGGAFFALAFFAVVEPGAKALGGLVVGALWGAAVVGLIRLFRVAPWGYAVAGLLCGPIPLLVLTLGDEPSGEDRFALWLIGAVFGLLIGLLEQARVRRAQSGTGAREEGAERRDAAAPP
jgi:hypothetical protein